MATEAFHRTVFVHMFEAVFSSIRSPHGKTSNTKVRVCHILYKFRLESFSFRMSERKILSVVVDSLKLEIARFLAWNLPIQVWNFIEHLRGIVHGDFSLRLRLFSGL